ncbi:unnamed protein product, partial [Medioppia subpectinata]
KSDPTSKPSNFTIRTGTLLRLDGNEYPVAKIVQHPQWNYWGFKNSDIALMKINGTIDMGENIKPIDLPKTLFEEPVREHVIVAGWGKQFLNSSVTLLLANEFKLNVIPNGRCAQAYTSIQYMTYKSQLCTWNRNQTVCEFSQMSAKPLQYRSSAVNDMSVTNGSNGLTGNESQRQRPEEDKEEENDDNNDKRGLVLSEKQMHFLRYEPYLYNCYVSSFMENMFLQKFWFKLSQYVPISIAPCTITCIGLIINLITSATLFYYSPDAKQTVPNWAFLTCAVGLFLYQLLDALDGKQAVKVQDTPIEEVYDHGCDAVSAFLVTQSVTIAAQLGDSPVQQFIFFIVPLIAFYMTHYCCHVTRVMVFGRIDVIEGQWAIIIVHTLAYGFGQQIFMRRLFLLDITVRDVLFALTILSLIGSIVSNGRLILGADTPMDRYVRIPRMTGLTKWYPLVSLVILILLSVMGFNRQVFHTNPLLFIITFGLAFAKLSFKLQMMNVTHGVMSRFDTCIIAPVVLVLNSYANLLSNNTCLVVALLYALCDHVLYFSLSSIDMKRALDL